MESYKDTQRPTALANNHKIHFELSRYLYFALSDIYEYYTPEKLFNLYRIISDKLTPNLLVHYNNNLNQNTSTIICLKYLAAANLPTTDYKIFSLFRTIRPHITNIIETEQREWVKKNKKVLRYAPGHIYTINSFYICKILNTHPDLYCYTVRSDEGDISKINGEHIHD